jgi:hypothetical protein
MDTFFFSGWCSLEIAVECEERERTTKPLWHLAAGRSFAVNSRRVKVLKVFRSILVWKQREAMRVL